MSYMLSSCYKINCVKNIVYTSSLVSSIIQSLELAKFLELAQQRYSVFFYHLIPRIGPEFFSWDNSLKILYLHLSLFPYWLWIFSI